jgi:hypothetical protein
MQQVYARNDSITTSYKRGHSYCHESLNSRAGFAGPACIGQGCAADAPRFIRYDTKDAQDLLGELVIR